MPLQLPTHLKRRCLLVSGLLFLPGLAGAQIWSEEFNSGSAPNSAVWSYDLGASGWGNSELQNYTSDAANVRVEGGNLIITARKQGNNITSARVKTEDKLTFQYGTVEARIKVPDLADGLWPAFWTLGNNFSSAGWPDCGEIDVLEMGSAAAINANRVNRRVQSHAHWESGGAHADYGDSLNRPSDIDGSFHIYRMEWTPTAITTFIDNVQIWSMSISDPASFDGEEFHQPHFFILNLAVGGAFTDIFNPNGITAPFPAEYVIDYVRIFDNGHTVLGGSSFMPPAGQNVLANPGFESGTTGWTLNSAGGTVTDTTSPARSGSRSLRINNSGAGAWASPNAVQSFSAAPGDVFNLRGYMRTSSPISDGTFGLLKMVFKDSAGNDLLPASADVGTVNTSFPGVESDPVLNGSSPANQWVFTEAQGEAPAGTTQVLFFLLNVNPPGSATSVYFDDLDARLLGEPDLIVPVTLSASLVGGNIELSFPTQDGVTYVVTSKASLTDASWTYVGTIPGDGTTKSRSYPVDNPVRLYRVEAY